ncbi:MAG: CBS domain-containing protein [Deltaproteobacteria bacterium]|nr:CBS domain-containing protein [Deltaproteobacteria bacterium]
MNAESLMTKDPLTAHPESKVIDVMNLMMEHDIRHIPITDKGDLVGMISDRDLQHTFNLLRDSMNDARAFLDRRAVDIMQGDVIQVEPDASVSLVASCLVENQIGALLVVNPDGRLEGIISYVDILKVVADQG